MVSVSLRVVAYSSASLPDSIDSVAARHNSTASFASSGVTVCGASSLSTQFTKYCTSVKYPPSASMFPAEPAEPTDGTSG